MLSMYTFLHGTPLWLKTHCEAKITRSAAAWFDSSDYQHIGNHNQKKRDNPEQGSNCSQVISRRAHFSRRESGTCVLVAGPSEQLIEDAKDQSAHHRKDARR